MVFLLNSQAQGVSGKNEQSSQTPWRGVPEARDPMQLHRLHRLKAGPEMPDEEVGTWGTPGQQDLWLVPRRHTRRPLREPDPMCAC